ncbi:hypothetical protein QYS48_30035 [Marivirga arenosa]|uniref:Lipoprotein n=1 Tax=Marivirga arenosa TaxID=3059076 RepID=A0AA51N849_9BACT|nr:hypothetical protein [Marivirga sp. ABR2-2]WMN07833.1 hypothetical protein QYS48_30035 [Marivirga sp. ABR2-2]
MINFSRILFAFLLFGIISCETAVREKPINEYYDVDALVDQQAKLLSDMQPKIEKSVEVDGQKEMDTLEFDSLGWKNELEVFKLADINKPTLFDAYEATEEQTSNGKIWRYSTEKPSLGIEFLYVYFDQDSTVKKLEARYHENNALYISERNFEINFNNTNGTPVLASYKIYGRQKMAMKDEVYFSIESEVVN